MRHVLRVDFLKMMVNDVSVLLKPQRIRLRHLFATILLFCTPSEPEDEKPKDEKKNPTLRR